MCGGRADAPSLTVISSSSEWAVLLLLLLRPSANSDDLGCQMRCIILIQSDTKTAADALRTRVGTSASSTHARLPSAAKRYIPHMMRAPRGTRLRLPTLMMTMMTHHVTAAAAWAASSVCGKGQQKGFRPLSCSSKHCAILFLYTSPAFLLYKYSV